MKQITVSFPDEDSAKVAYAVVQDAISRERSDSGIAEMLRTAGAAFYASFGPLWKKSLKRKEASRPKRKYVSHKLKPKKPAKKDRSRRTEGAKKAWATRRAKKAEQDGQQYHPSMEQVTTP
jgi:hypothetical protein